MLSLRLVLTLNSFQTRLKTRNLLAVEVHHAERVHRRAFGSLQAIVVVQFEIHELRQLRELVRDAAWRASQYVNKPPRKLKALSTDAELTSDRIARDIKMGQIDQIAEFLGQFPCQKRECQQNTKPSTDAELTFNLVVENVQMFQIDELSELLWQAS